MFQRTLCQRNAPYYQDVYQGRTDASRTRPADARCLQDQVETMLKRRTFLQRLFGGLGAAVASPAVVAENRSVLIQESPLAGFQFHRGDAVWSSLAVGAPLQLVREPDNSHDADAVAVYFNTEKLGYVPRGENGAVAQMLDRGEGLAATISRLTVDEDPWQRVRFNVYLV